MNPKRRSGGSAEAAARLAAAREFLESAQDDLAKHRVRAVIAHAAESSIASADVIAYAGIGARAAGPSHSEAVAVLHEAGEEEGIIFDLTLALESKNPAQNLEDWIATPDDITESIARAQRLLERADAVFIEAGATRWARPPLEDSIGAALRALGRSI